MNTFNAAAAIYPIKKVFITLTSHFEYLTCQNGCQPSEIDLIMYSNVWLSDRECMNFYAFDRSPPYWPEFKTTK
jgi:hypothetical protein